MLFTVYSHGIYFQLFLIYASNARICNSCAIVLPLTLICWPIFLQAMGNRHQQQRHSTLHQVVWRGNSKVLLIFIRCRFGCERECECGCWWWENVFVLLTNFWQSSIAQRIAIASCTPWENWVGSWCFRLRSRSARNVKNIYV